MSDLSNRARASLAAEDYDDARGAALCALADSVEDLVAVVRDSLRVPVVFNITNEKLSHEQGSAIAEKLRRLLNPATVRDVDLTPEAVPHD